MDSTMTMTKNESVETSSTSNISNATTSSDSIAIQQTKQEPYGAAFSLASLEQGSRGSLSLMNLNMSFDTEKFFRSFDSLQGLGSQIFKDPSILQQIQPAFIIPNGEKLSQSSSTMLSSQQTPSNQIALSNHSSQQSNVITSIKSMVPTPIPSNVIATSSSISNQVVTVPLSQQQFLPPFGNNAFIQPKENEKRIVERKDENSKFVDVTPFLTLPQHEAAKKLGIPSSTLAKRWKEASCNRKWPYRTVSKLDKEILTLLKNVENAKAELSPSVESTLGLLLKKRQEELKTVLVRL